MPPRLTSVFIAWMIEERYNKLVTSHKLKIKSIMNKKSTIEEKIKEKVGERYDHLKIEPKWEKIWEEKKTFSVDIKNAKKPFYNLAMFPYPSAEGLHVGHIIPYSGVDTFGRFMRMKGFDVFEPMGFDAFGIHSENFAIKKGIHPATLTAQTTKYFKEEQMRKLGTLFDWKRMVDTSDPNYYKWTQWIFIKMFKAGLVERKKALVNWCPSCKTVLSDEQVIDESCERCKNEVEKREMEQWFFKITKYAEKLLQGTYRINWSQKTLVAQRNWIGRSEGAIIKFQIQNPNFQSNPKSKDSNGIIEVFTTRPDTLGGTTFLVLAPEHKFTAELLKLKTQNSKLKTELKNYINKAKMKTEQERIAEGRDKTGVFSGLNAINPLTKEEIPIWIADYIVLGYGTGAIMAVPAHDQRDFDFAKKFNISIKEVISGGDVINGAHMGEGKIINSNDWNGLKYPEDLKKIIDWLEENNIGRKKINYKLRDWCVSRQRYWGPPIPMIFCKKCGWQSVNEEDLPVLLPETIDYLPDGNGKSPLARIPDFVKTKCPHCRGEAKRETDVSDTFLDSSWYFLRYPTVSLPNSDKEPFNPEVTKKWLPVDMYIGGNEHAVLHLMYARFVTMALKDMGYINFEEPFKKFFAHGLMIKDGAKMSKSRGNVVNPNIYLDKFGADTLRMYILFLGPYDGGGDFRDTGIAGMYRFLGRVWRWAINEVEGFKKGTKDHGLIIDDQLWRGMQKLIRGVSLDLENLRFNTGIAKMMEYLNEVTGNKLASNKLEILENYILLIAPFAPHLAEELFQKLRESKGENGFISVHDQKWPEYDKNMIEDQVVTIIVQINGKLRDRIEIESEKLKVKNINEDIIKIAKESDRIKKFLEGKKILKEIYVPLKLVNFVVE